MTDFLCTIEVRLASNGGYQVTYAWAEPRDCDCEDQVRGSELHLFSTEKEMRADIAHFLAGTGCWAD